MIGGENWRRNVPYNQNLGGQAEHDKGIPVHHVNLLSKCFASVTEHAQDCTPKLCMLRNGLICTTVCASSLNKISHFLC